VFEGDCLKNTDPPDRTAVLERYSQLSEPVKEGPTTAPSAESQYLQQLAVHDGCCQAAEFSTSQAAVTLAEQRAYESAGNFHLTLIEIDWRAKPSPEVKLKAIATNGAQGFGLRVPLNTLQ
jgi:hypothetical protein